jgi:hypothetical protein
MIHDVLINPIENPITDFLIIALGLVLNSVLHYAFPFTVWSDHLADVKILIPFKVFLVLWVVIGADEGLVESDAFESFPFIMEHLGVISSDACLGVPSSLMVHVLTDFSEETGEVVPRPPILVKFPADITFNDPVLLQNLSPNT